MYWKGPFLAFLRAQPKAGIEAVVRLVNHATSRWLEAAAGPDATEERRSRFGLEFTFGDRTVVWSGDANVFGWHRTSSLHCSTVECALMALEKWLYEELDAKREIADSVQVVFQDARSLAFAGVLIAVGMRQPQLFAGVLLPLLGNFHIFRTQLSWAQHESAEMWRSELANLGEQLAPMAVEWHRLPHRRYLLQDLAQRVMLHHDELQRYLSDRVRTTWAALLEHPGVERDSVELMLARFDSANYKKTPQPDGTVLIEWTVPAELSARLATRQQGTSIKLLSVGLAPRARRLLRDQEALTSAEIDAFAEDVQRLGSWQPADLDRAEQQYRINSLAGGIAVLVIKHRIWLSEHTEIEDWCFEVAQTVTALVDGERDSPMSLLENNAEAFLGELGVALLAERQDEWVSRLAFNGVTGYFYSSTWRTMWLACDRRATLGHRFDELINVLAFWSALRLAAMRESRHLDDPLALNRFREALYRRYARGRLRGPLTPLKATETLGRRLARRIDRVRMSPEQRRVAEAREAWAADHSDARKRSRNTPDVDLEVLARGFGFLPAMMRGSMPEDEPRKTRYIDEMFELEMRTFLPVTAAGDELEVDGTPHYFDVWLIQNVAEFIAHAQSLEIARCYYQPILALGPRARYWVDDFLHGWVRVGLDVTTDRQMFVAIWQDMVDFTLAQPHWRPRVPGYWSPAESLATDLMGLDRESAAILGRKEFTDVVEAMAPAFKRWAAVWLTQATAAAGFAHFLVTEAGSVLLASGIPALAAVVSSFRKDDWDQQGLGLLITEALASCWTKLRPQVEREQELREAFLTLLTDLSARQVPEALHLRDRVSTLFGSS
ncbi:MAG: hypothetical protein ABL986_22285 [Vicinamibacterales bacterium]